MKAKPESLWLFSNGDMTVLRKDSEGKHALEQGPGGAADRSYILSGIEAASGDCEGGGW